MQRRGNYTEKGVDFILKNIPQVESVNLLSQGVGSRFKFR